MAEITQHVQNIHSILRLGYFGHSIQFVLEFHISKNSHDLGNFISSVRARDSLNLETRQKAQFYNHKQKWRMEIPSVRSL